MGLPSIILSEKETTKKELLEAGSYLARCISIIQLGSLQEEKNGKQELVKKIALTFELPTELRKFKEEDGEQPIVKSKWFTESLHEMSNLRKFLKGWRGIDFSDDELRGFDIVKLLGVPCMLSIVHNEKKDGTKTDAIGGISKVPKGMTVPDQIGISTVFSWSQFDEEIFNSLPEYLREMMKKTPEYAYVCSPEFLLKGTKSQIGETDLPFDKF